MYISSKKNKEAFPTRLLFIIAITDNFKKLSTYTQFCCSVCDFVVAILAEIAIISVMSNHEVGDKHISEDNSHSIDECSID